ncbi:MAG: hypothetical protein AB1589_26780 [Cyanobacteriota bacterium]
MIIFITYTSRYWFIPTNDEFLYYQEIGKIYAKKYSKRLREISLANVWIALFEEMLIASSKNKSDVEEIVKQILPKQKQKLVYIFHVKGK